MMNSRKSFLRSYKNKLIVPGKGGWLILSTSYPAGACPATGTFNQKTGEDMRIKMEKIIEFVNDEKISLYDFLNEMETPLLRRKKYYIVCLIWFGFGFALGFLFTNWGPK
jgi:hypothetical protein